MVSGVFAKNIIEPKYEIIADPGSDKFMSPGSTTRIRALKDFGDVKKGDLGGSVESFDCLSQEGDCWVYPGALVKKGARVTGNAKVGYPSVMNRIIITTGHVTDNARVVPPVNYRGGTISGNSHICSTRFLYGTMQEVKGDFHNYDRGEEVRQELAAIAKDRVPFETRRLAAEAASAHNQRSRFRRFFGI